MKIKNIKFEGLNSWIRPKSDYGPFPPKIASRIAQIRYLEVHQNYENATTVNYQISPWT